MKYLLAHLFIFFTLISFSIANESASSIENFPVPFLEKVEGWPVEWNPVFQKSENRILYKEVKKALANHLQRITYILDQKKVEVLRTLYIRVDLNHKLTNMQYHPNKRWLLTNKHDPTLEKRVHIPKARQLLSKDQWAKHPYVVLHELAHSYHDQILSFDHQEIINSYQRAEKKGLYEKVLLFRGGKTSHYARTNHKEFFAEMSESYLGVNDFYPFVRAELEEHDPTTFALMKKIWGKI